MASTETVHDVEVTHPDKELWRGVTKTDLAHYYDDVADVMLPHLRDRPVSMQRFPDGIGGHGFYEKRIPAHFPEWVDRVTVPTADGEQEQVVVSNARSLVYLAQQACVTPHVWLSRRRHLHQPDLLVVDLDPSGRDLPALRRATRLVGELLDGLGLVPFLRTTGSRGYHVTVPLRPEAGFDEVRAVAAEAADLLVEREPGLFTRAARVADRGDLVYLDVLRNGYGQTVVAPYAPRARPGAPVSTPLEWEELSSVEPDGYDLARVRRRLAQRADPWAGLRRRARGLGRARERLAAMRS
ncbi:DNA ligase [Phycicoccus endophyticus]|uniref:DNA ligase n=1 Tax=Phycicoccus endophyticus TaxID=1690220 RepID=A0A7G9R086_9MICO|nr:non-homologous end-joining DNA ligase [Phycicoccus endophyticus]NHI20190.1 DNA ligase [Phycicoccus endophyticus]QNN49011.1 DNA ligase [Phycicoccus endophyticus]GGL44580.1 ATP-dependent DNA ligase [Phycicoccus endophyticus]